MNFRTELHPNPAAYKLNQTAKVVTVGSCFSDVIGRQLEKYKVETLTNPFGTIFNPLSACKLLQVCAGADVELADSFVQNNGRWYSYDFHSSFSADNEETLYEMLDEVIVKTRRFLKQADVLILTLGTANIFRLNITGETVANCHKLPANNFTRETLLPEEIITGIAETHSLLRELNPNLKLVLTVSPVRHLKDTLELNSVSKSVLRLATHFLTQSLPDITYFPAYELLIDDLRDYRFYKEDLLHPTPLAEQYIWEKFTGAYFESTFTLFTQEWDKIIRAREHKPFHPESAQHQAFIQDTIEKLRTLQEKVNVAEELAYFESQVIILPEPEEETDAEEDEETAEEEVIPGYFSEEKEVASAEETVEMAVAALNQPASATLPEDGQVRKKKKKKKKKKRPVNAEEGVSLAEVGTTREPDYVKAAAQTTEAIAEVNDVLAIPEHPLAHYGETLSEAPAEQIRPIVTAKSKSAKRRESRRKKKALSASETAFVHETSAELAALLQPEASVSEVTFAGVKDTVSEHIQPEPIANPEIEMEPVEPGKRPVKARNDRKKKKTYPDLFAPVTSEIELQTSGENLKDLEPPIATANSESEGLNQETVSAEAKVQNPKGRGRKPKTAKLFTEAELVSETIAVPFVPVTEITEKPTEAISPAAPKGRTARRPAAPKPAKAPFKTAKGKAAKEPIPAVLDPVIEKPKKRPGRAKTEVQAKPEAKAKPAKTPTKPGRKKKAAPEASE